MAETKHGEYTPINPSKYRGAKPPIYRSSWEQRVCYYMDTNVNVIMWGSEDVKIPYLYRVDGKMHTYYPDFVCRIKERDGSISTHLIEVKPEKQTKPPVAPKNRGVSRRRTYEDAMATYLKNIDKWESAKEYCSRNNMKFTLLTEKEIF